jgi:outer membrane protein assembly factor BamB
VVWTAMRGPNDMMSGGAFSSPVIQTIHGNKQLVVQSRTQLAGLHLESGSSLWSHDVAAFRGMNILTPTIWDNAVFTSSYGGRSLLIDILPDGKTKVRWENKVEGYMSSPIVIDHFVYLHLRNKRFACIDLQTGQEKWVTQPFGEYWSMVSDGNRILALDQTGVLRLLAHDPNKFTLLSDRKISEQETWAHIVEITRSLRMERRLIPVSHKS